MKKFSSAKTALVLSMLIFGTIGIFVRNISVSSSEIALYRAVLAAVVIGVFLLCTKQNIDFKKIKKDMLPLAVSGIAMGFNWILLFEAYKYTTVSAATLAYYFAPVIVTVACPIIFKEKMGVKDWICFGASTLGIVLVTGVGASGEGSNHLLGVLLGLGAACLYASVILLNKFIKNVGGIHRTFLQFIFAIAVLAPYVLATDGINLASLDTLGWGCLLTLGLVHTGVAYCLYFSSLGALSGQKVAILSYIDPLTAVLLSVFVLGESMGVLQIIGGVLILGFTLWNEIGTEKKK